MIALAMLALVTPAPDAPVRIPRADGTETIVVVPDQGPFDAEAGDTIVVRFPGSDGIEEAKFLAECEDMGGQLRWTVMFDRHGEFVCEGVDF